MSEHPEHRAAVAVVEEFLLSVTGVAFVSYTLIEEWYGTSWVVGLDDD